MKTDEADLRLGGWHRAGWLYAGIWLVYLLVPLVDNFNRKYAPWQQAVGMIGFWLFCYAYSRLAFVNRRVEVNSYRPWGADRRATLFLLEVAALALVLPLLSTPAWIALWIYVSSACGAALPFGRRRWALYGGFAASAAMLLEAVLLDVDAGTWSWMLLPAVFSCFAVIGVRRLRNLIAELREAREEVKHLAANEERLRLARDLHDLAGHSMATITLKAELARRLLPNDTGAAEKQLVDIEQVSRQALADIREAVSGYRRATLAVETASARTALEAAQIAFELDPAVLGRAAALEPEAESALAWCLREAVTNVVRHSGASRCRVRLIEARVDGATTVTLEVTDDGRAVPCAAPEDREAQGHDAHGLETATADRGAAGFGRQQWGNGLTGLRERLAPFAATLNAGPLSPHGFRLTATLPVG
jgi:two-component system, NarL family, sensor histidine kinase DesK